MKNEDSILTKRLKFVVFKKSFLKESLPYTILERHSKQRITLKLVMLVCDMNERDVIRRVDFGDKYIFSLKLTQCQFREPFKEEDY